MKQLALVCLGGAIGASMRWGIAMGLQWKWPKLAESFPYATLLVNLTGCFAIGIGVGLLGRDGVKWGPELQLLLIVGVCGSLTTFSTFANQTLDLASGKAILNIIASVAGGLFLAWAGMQLTGGKVA
ncbi:MAG: fluoride efflux transporter CrcB [Planctomycetes bacterium]|nr:fluoride efflux transporter CrcB [Planctomycetota bacterium]